MFSEVYELEVIVVIVINCALVYIRITSECSVFVTNSNFIVPVIPDTGSYIW